MAYSNFPFWFLKWCRNANKWRFLIHAGIYISLRYYFPLDWVQCTMKCFICKILFKWTFRNVKPRYTFWILKRKEMDLNMNKKICGLLGFGCLKFLCVWMCVCAWQYVFQMENTLFEHGLYMCLGESGTNVQRRICYDRVYTPSIPLNYDYMAL